MSVSASCLTQFSEGMEVSLGKWLYQAVMVNMQVSENRMLLLLGPTGLCSR